MKTSSVASLLALALVTVAGCASSGYGHSALLAEPHTAPALDLVLEDTAARPSFPARLGAAETPPAAIKLAGQVKSELGGEARADLRVCVDATGAVNAVGLMRSSGIDALDAALVDGARGWRYQAPAATVCHKVDVTYRVR